VFAILVTERFAYPFVSLPPDAFRKRGPVHLRSAITGKIGSPVTIRHPTYKFEIIGAGYDKDGKLRLRKLVLTLHSNLTVDRKKVWTHTISTENAITENGMSHLLGGIRDVSETILNDPDQFPTSAAIKRYAGIENGNNQKPLSLSELAALAYEMAAQTSRTPGFAGFVGGPDQIAILANGKIQKLEQPTFPAPPRPMKFVLMADLGVRPKI
jgi:hypothetical protein